jgi:hypothetical protein
MVNALRRVKLLVISREPIRKDIYEFSENGDLVLVSSTTVLRTKTRKKKRERRGLLI